MDHEDVEIISRDGLRLHGYFIESKTPSDKIAILVHGYAGKVEEMSAYENSTSRDFHRGGHSAYDQWRRFTSKCKSNSF